MFLLEVKSNIKRKLHSLRWLCGDAGKREVFAVLWNSRILETSIRGYASRHSRGYMPPSPLASRCTRAAHRLRFRSPTLPVSGTAALLRLVKHPQEDLGWIFFWPINFLHGTSSEKNHILKGHSVIESTCYSQGRTRINVINFQFPKRI